MGPRVEILLEQIVLKLDQIIERLDQAEATRRSAGPLHVQTCVHDVTAAGYCRKCGG